MNLLSHMPDSVRNNQFAKELLKNFTSQENRKPISGEACPRCGCRLESEGNCHVCGYDINTTDRCPACDCRYNLINFSDRLCPVCGLEKALVLGGIFVSKSEVRCHA